MGFAALEKTKARAAARQIRAGAANNYPGARIEMLRHWPAQAFRGCSVALYMRLHSEIDPSALLAALCDSGHEICLPRIARKAHPLMFHQYVKGDPLRRGPFGVLEPLADAREIQPQIMLVPLLAFDGRGGRLGYGGGFYDRTIAKLRDLGRVHVVGLAYSAQEIPAAPMGPYDERLDAVLTDKEYREFT